MPVKKKGKKYAIGSGKPMYKTKAAAERAYVGYLGSKAAEYKHRKRKKKRKKRS